ncbi:MAG: hypothetical protein Alpg2KO_07340 [Alphaproteobacteria bacterium]
MIGEIQMTTGREYRQRGATGLGYGLMIGLVGIVALGSITTVGTNVVSLFDRVATDINGGGQGPQGQAGSEQAQSSPQPPACTPGTAVFSTPTESENFAVSAMDPNCTTLGFAMWGGGGGGGAPRGGSGGYVTGTLPIDTGATYAVYVGSAGVNYLDASAQSGSGGTASAITLGGSVVAVAGAGGGAGSNGNATGGAGGGNSSAAGAVAGETAPTVNSDNGGGGGGVSSAGAAGTGSRRSGVAGSGANGGDGADPCLAFPNRRETTGWGDSGSGYGYLCGDGGGGGGGAGYFGGGGGGSGPSGAGGGGGSSFRSGSLTTGGSMERGSLGASAGTSSPHFANNAGLGGPGGNDGTDGRVVFYWE